GQLGWFLCLLCYTPNPPTSTLLPYTTLFRSIIAAPATLSATLLQLRISLAREFTARTQGAGRRKSRTPFLILFVMVVAAAVAGFALSRWLTENERLAQSTLEHELRARVEEISR